MPCDTVKLPDGAFAMVCSRGRRGKPPARCFYCTTPSSRLCDYPAGSGKTCDRPLCLNCTTEVAKDTDMCKEHAPMWNRPEARR